MLHTKIVDLTKEKIPKKLYLLLKTLLGQKKIFKKRFTLNLIKKDTIF